MTDHPVSNGDLNEEIGTTGSQSTSPPVTRRLTLAFATSLVIALLAAIACVGGLLYGSTLYPTEEMLLLKLPTDLFTLVLGLPLLLGSIWLARRGELLGLLCWPGMLLYLSYVYLSYAIGVPFSAMFLVYLLLVVLNVYTLIGLVASIDAPAVRRRLAGTVPERYAGGILAGMAVLFTLINLGGIVTDLTSPAPDYLLDFPVWIADSVVVAPAWLVGGVLLWQRKALGYVASAGLLLVGSMLFVGTIVTLLYPAFYASAPVDLVGVVFILVAGLICFVPFALVARGIVKSGRGPSPAERADPEQ